LGFIRYYYQRAENPDNMKKKIPTSTSEEQLIAYFCHELKDKEQQEVEEWLISLEKREINLPLILRQEAIELIP
jgi:hypothetical protein